MIHLATATRGLLVLPVLSLFVAAAQLVGQEAPEPTRIWLGVGLAVGGSTEWGGFGPTVNAVWQRGPHRAAIRAGGLFDFTGFPDSGSDDSVAELALLYGRSAANSFGSVAIGAGAAAVTFHGCPDGSAIRCVTIGLPLFAEAALQSKVMGIGIQAFGNLNPRSSFGGVALVLHLGWMPR